jgi:hypothetical protein
VDVELGHGLAGEAAARGEGEDEGLVERLARGSRRVRRERPCSGRGPASASAAARSRGAREAQDARSPPGRARWPGRRSCRAGSGLVHGGTGNGTAPGGAPGAGVVGCGSRRRPRASGVHASKKSELVLVCLSLEIRNSMASVVPIGLRIRRRT